MLRTLFDRAALPSGRIVFVHARLRNLHAATGETYAGLAAELIDCLWAIRPTTILVPAYTIYAFMLGRVFHRCFSHSEVGRFSEEVRVNASCWRSPDPMYSVLDLGNYLQQLPDISYSRTFGSDSLFEHLHQQDALIINIDIDGFLSTQVHGVELSHQVDYRFEKKFSGIVFDDEQSWRRVNYQAFVRNVSEDFSQYPPYNRRRRTEYLRAQGSLHTSNLNGIELSWIGAQDFRQQIDTALNGNRRFLVD